MFCSNWERGSLVFIAISNVLLSYIQALLKRKVKKPYSPMVDSVNPRGIHALSPQQMPSSLSLTSTLGAVNSD